MVQKLHVDALIQALEAVRHRPSLYIGPVDASQRSLTSLITGVRLVCDCFGLVFDEDTYREVARERGWEFNSIYPDPRHIKEVSQRDDSFVTDEILAIEIATWKRLQQDG